MGYSHGTVQIVNMVIDGGDPAIHIGDGIGSINYSTIYTTDNNQSFAAVVCDSPGVNFNADILVATAVTATSGCTFTSSLVSADANGPSFVNPAAVDFHLTSTSTAIDKVSAGPAVDRDGVARPQGTSFDIGAYEYKP